MCRTVVPVLAGSRMRCVEWMLPGRLMIEFLRNPQLSWLGSVLKQEAGVKEL
jgi:hypothetical protein